MAVRPNLKCKGCGKMFPRNELISYAGRGGVSFNYCPECYDIKLKHEKFSDFICAIFCIRAPGPRIYAERKRLNENGFTDKTIMMTLEYIYRICGEDNSLASLFKVTKENAELAKNYFDQERAAFELQEQQLAVAEEAKIQYASIQKPQKQKTKQKYNLDNLEEEEW